MNTIERTMRWGETHHPAWLDPLRMVLGLILFIKGILFIRDTEALSDMMANTSVEFASFLIAHYVAMVHLVGGLMIAMGLLTRVAALFNLPILFGAVFYLNMRDTYAGSGTELILSVVVLLLLIVFLVVGSGRHSVDNYYRKYRDR